MADRPLRHNIADFEWVSVPTCRRSLSRPRTSVTLLRSSSSTAPARSSRPGLRQLAVQGRELQRTGETSGFLPAVDGLTVDYGSNAAAFKITRRRSPTPRRSPARSSRWSCRTRSRGLPPRATLCATRRQVPQRRARRRHHDQGHRYPDDRIAQLIDRVRATARGRPDRAADQGVRHARNCPRRHHCRWASGPSAPAWSSTTPLGSAPALHHPRHCPVRAVLRLARCARPVYSFTDYRVSASHSSSVWRTTTSCSRRHVLQGARSHLLYTVLAVPLHYVVSLLASRSC